MDIIDNIILYTIIALILYMWYSCNAQKTESLEKYDWKWAKVPKFADLNVAPYSGFNYDMFLKYYYDSPSFSIVPA